MLRWTIFFMRNIYVYQWRSKGEGARVLSAPGSKINPLLNSLIISDIMLKSKNKATSSDYISTKTFKTTQNAAKYILTLYMIHK